jgi:hypothetical protein
MWRVVVASSTDREIGMLSIAEFALIRTKGGMLLLGYEAMPGLDPSSIEVMRLNKLDDGLYELADSAGSVVRFAPLTSRDVLKISSTGIAYLAPLSGGAFGDAYPVRIDGVPL